MPFARVFRSGSHEAVRLPKQFRLRGPEVEIFRRGDEIVLREKGRGLAQAFELSAACLTISSRPAFWIAWKRKR